jgi:hypothetical protein
MTTFSYPALLIKQTAFSKPMVLLSAPAAEIVRWAGIPQKKQFPAEGEFGGEETIGFQREENVRRIDSIGKFFDDERNVVQNPLLCAARIGSNGTVEFISEGEVLTGTQVGRLEIKIPDYWKIPFVDILKQVRDYLESRVPELKESEVRESLITSLKVRAKEIGHALEEDEISLEEEAYDAMQNSAESSDEEDDGTDTDVVSALFEESHIYDFWEEVAARHEVAKQIKEPILSESFLGFTRDALSAYVYPVVLVDGQHRLKGALKSAENKIGKANYFDEIEERVLGGESPDKVKQDLLTKQSRILPLSVLMDADASEQVFQFVVVNQKATPIGKALLGTIVSTTLAKEEMEQVAGRLKDAGIALEESQATSYVTRLPSSPFYGKVERGVSSASDINDLLKWNVLSSLITIFRKLRGGKLYGEQNDYAAIWRKKWLDESLIVTDYLEKGFSTPYDYWSSTNGPWRGVFIEFWKEIRNYFGSDDPESHNYWGNPRKSNLFNKPTLTILTADFFQYLIESKSHIESASQVPVLVKEWLQDVKKEYFNRDWNLGGVKKDSTGIRSKWAAVWKEYRKNPEQLPQTKTYRLSKGAN